MTRTTTADEQFFEMLREIDPLVDRQTDAVDVKGDLLLQRILSSERVSRQRPGRQDARRRRLVLSAASTGGVAAAAVAAVLVFTAHAPSTAFAGWSAYPTAPTGGQVRAAESDCQRNSALASLTPTFADTRGPYTLLVYVGSLCVTGPSLESPTGQPPFAPFGAFLSAASAAEQRTQPNTTSVAPNTTSVASDAIQTIGAGGLTTKASADFGFDVGRVGTSVTAVTLVLQNGSRIEATTSNGWFAAWWPGGQFAQTAEVTTTSGTKTQQLTPAGASSPAGTGAATGSPDKP
jgi:hypothetical protein